MAKPPKTYYLPGKIVRESDCLIARHLLVTHRMNLSALRRITSLPVPSLIDEVGLVIEDKAGNRIWVRETDLHFHWLVARLNADELLGDNWYARAENGEHITATVPA